MQILKTVLIAIALASLTVFLIQKTGGNRTGESTIFHSKVINVRNGYGYEIFTKNKLLIRQEYIPVIAGNRPFTNTRDAQMAAKLVISKLEFGGKPEITRKELEELNLVAKEVENSQ